MITEELKPKPIDSLTRAFIVNYPADAARSIESMAPSEALEVIKQQSVYSLSRLFEKLSVAFAVGFVDDMPEEEAVGLLKNLEMRTATDILRHLDEEKRNALLDLFHKSVAAEYRSLLEYPHNTAGYLMLPQVYEFHEDTTASQALEFLKARNVGTVSQIYLTDDSRRLSSQVDIQRLALADGQEKLATLSRPVRASVQAFDTRDDVVEILNKLRVSHLPVVDIDLRLLGVIDGAGLIDALRENFASGMQTMVGVSADERALSTSFFSVKKRQPWLQINLLTAFMAAGVVAIFEDTISRFTALAILLPIAAGQSGNAGAQALAVTMRGLTLKEISMSHWLRVMLKECGAGFMNGIGIAITCSLGIYIWSGSGGLALVMALAMIISMTIAGMSGALVPIVLKRFGLDPAQSSSIVLTTVTDIAGFMSFLGIATALSSMLVEG